MERLFTETERLNQTLFVIHFENKEKRDSSKSNKAPTKLTLFHYDHIKFFNDINSYQTHVRNADLFFKRALSLHVISNINYLTMKCCLMYQNHVDFKYQTTLCALGHCCFGTRKSMQIEPHMPRRVKEYFYPLIQ